MPIKCFVFTMYNEHSNVLKSIQQIRSKLPTAYICCAHSFDKQTNELNQIKKLSNSYIQLPNLGKQFSKFELPSQCICRNYSAGFSDIYKNVNDIEYIVALTGDTLVIDANNFERRYAEMKKNKIIMRVTQQIGARLHAATDNPPKGVERHRYQNRDTTDFFPQLFIIDGNFAKTHKAFSNINITNRWTSEQCLGDEMLKYVSKKDFHYKITRLNKKPTNAYAYGDGVRYHATTKKK